MPNTGEKDVILGSLDGHTRMLRMQVTDVQQALLKVSRMCDTGHRVVFTRKGGYIQHNATTWRWPRSTQSRRASTGKRSEGRLLHLPCQSA